MDPTLFETPELFGADATTGIVACEPVRGGMMRLYRRDAAGALTEETVPERPFLLLKRGAALPDAVAAELVPLAGEHPFRLLARFPDRDALDAALAALRDRSGRTPSDPKAPYLHFADPVHRHLLATGRTLFKGMTFGALRRLAVDIETHAEPGFSFCNPARASDRVLCIGLAGSDGFRRMLSGRDGDEKRLLQAFVDAVRDHDPDVIEGHNLFKFDLWYLKARCDRHKVKFALGRDGATAKARTSRLQIAERTVDYPKFEIHGRHVVDTWVLCQMHDVSGRDLPSYGLKDVARHFGLASEERTLVPPEAIAATYAADPDRVERYCADDAEECLRLSALLSPPYFQQAKIFPWSYQNVIVRGNATKINALLLREYLRRGHAIPEASEGAAPSFEGGWTDIFATGVHRDVHHCDVMSLYPSIMLAFKAAPEKDVLGVFLALLATLRDFRLQAKAAMRRAKTPHARDEWNALQVCFKVLINSFYGYLGTSRHHFSDLAAAAAVTERGREIMRAMVEWLRARDALILELDTDGIYFQPAAPLPDPEGFIAELTATLPPGIEVEYDGDFAAMFSYKKKNYALLGRDGAMTVKGSGLKSRGLERFQREHLAALLRLLLEGGDAAAADRLRDEAARRLAEGRMGIHDLAKTETLVDGLDLYRRKIEGGKRNRAAAYELALASGRDFRPGDPVTWYVTGTKKTVRAFENAKLAADFDPAKPDYNIPHYLAKLEELHGKFAPFFAGARAATGEGQGSLFEG